MDVDSNLISAIGKVLNQKIKYICVVYMKKNPNESGKVIFCLGEESFHICDEQMRTKDDYNYEDIELIALDRRNIDQYFFHVKSNGLFGEKKKLTFSSSPREKLIKNFMCYYSVYYMNRYAEIRDVKLAELANETKKQAEKREFEEKNKKKLGNMDNFGKYKKLKIKKFCFYVKHSIVHNYNNTNLKINYVKEEGEPANNTYFSDGCEVMIEISDEILLRSLTADEREISFYAYNHFYIYMTNIIKSTNYWILKNTIYLKKFNLNEDKCVWDGWTIECRTSDPIYKNYVFIYYRRKFLPPFFDRMTNIVFILEEKCSSEKYLINPKAYEVIGTMSNSIQLEHNDLAIKEYENLLKAKFDGLLLDDETYYYFQNIMKIYGRDCYIYGSAVLLNILNFLEDNIKEKEKITPLKSYLDLKKKSLFSNDNNITNSDLHKKRLRVILEQFFQILDPMENKREEERKKLEMESDDGKKGESTPGFSQQRLAFISSKLKWKSKVNRFLFYCINGGLTDFGFTMENMLYYLARCPINIQEYVDFVYKIMDIRDLDANETDTEATVNISSLTENSNLSFNEEAVAVCIRSGWLSKYLSAESTKHCPNFIKLLLNRYLSNKLLYSICEFLKNLTKESQVEGGASDDSERREYSIIIDSLVKIFGNARNCPMIIILACKSLCALVSNENDYKNRLILIQNDIMTKIGKYIEERFDEKMVLCLLELMLLVLPESKLTIVNILYKENNVMEKLYYLLEGPGIAGTYFSIRTYVKIITIFLSLSNIHQADLRNQLCTEKYKKIFGKILRLLDEKNKVFEPTEELSYVLEHKIYYFISIIIFKNLTAQDILIDEFKLLGIIEEKCGKYNDLMNMILESRKNKTGLADQKIESLLKTVSKFYEMITYLLSGERGVINTERIKVINVKNNNFSNLFETMSQNDNFISNYEQLLTSFLWIKKILRSIETEDYV